jgi:hypothetical protein
MSQSSLVLSLLGTCFDSAETLQIGFSTCGCALICLQASGTRAEPAERAAAQLSIRAAAYQPGQLRA